MTASFTRVDQELSIAAGASEPPILDQTLGQALRGAADEAPDGLALVGSRDGRSWTYRQLLDQVEAVAAAMLARFDPGERIAIWAQNSPEWVIAEFALACAGLPIVTVNPAFGPSEAAYVLQKSRAAGVIATLSYRGRDLVALAKELQSSCPDLRDIIDIEELSAVDLAPDDTVEFPDVGTGDLVMIQYTSGTTGFPKGAQLHHHGIVTNAYHMMARNQFGRGDVMVGAMPLFHTAGSVLTVLGSVTHRGTLVLVDEFEPGHVLDAIERYDANLFSGVPTMLLALTEHPSYLGRDLSCIRVVTSGGAKVPAPLVQRLESELGVSFTIVFGQTELSPICTMTRPDDSVEDKAMTLGQPMPHVEIKIVDRAGETVPHGVAGELCARGYLTMLGYDADPRSTAQIIDPEGWLHTGDVCSMDSRGYCQIAGRLKDMIIRGGENIYPAEIEDVLLVHAAVSEVAVIGVPDERWGESVAAVIRTTPGIDVSPSELRDFARRSLASHKTPTQWYQVDGFPLTGSGKIRKFQLVEACEEGILEPMEEMGSTLGVGAPMLSERRQQQ